MILLFMLLT